MRKLGTSNDRRQVDILLSANRRYSLAMSRMFDAVDTKDFQRVESIHRQIDPTYDIVEHVIDRQERIYNRSAYRALSELDRTQSLVVHMTPLVGILGVGVLAAFFLLLQSYQRRDDSAVKSKMIQLARAASYDTLTSVGNHGAFEEALQVALDESIMGPTALKLALVDIDEFKLVNDRQGHQQGDAVLRAIGSLLQAHFPDIAFRTGGDEFAIVLPRMNFDGALFRLERLRTDRSDKAKNDRQHRCQWRDRRKQGS